MARSLPNPEDVIDLTNDDDSIHIDLNDSEAEDEGLKLAIALSLQESTEPDSQRTKATWAPPDIKSDASEGRPIDSEPSQDNAESNSESVSALSLLRLDRKQMEAERLARLKRKREDRHDPVSLPQLHRAVHRADSKPDSRDVAGASSSSDTKRHVQAMKDNNDPSSLEFPAGKIMLTSENKRKSNNHSTISMTELLRPTKPNVPLQSALLSTFIADFEWVLPHFDTRSVSFVLVLHAANGGHKSALQHDFDGIRNVRLVFPRVGGIINCMHSKLMLLFYGKIKGRAPDTGGRCRIVIPSANLTPYDWGVSGVMENTVFVIDLPEKRSAMDDDAVSSRSRGHFMTKFQDDLMTGLSAMDVPEAVLEKLHRFDFSATKDLRFVHTIGGSHQMQVNIANTVKDFSASTETTSQSTRNIKTGVLCLSDAVTSIGLASQPGGNQMWPKLDFITSSLGNLKVPFLQNLFLAVCGLLHTQSNSANLTSAFGLEAKSAVARINPPSLHDIKQQLRIYFPSNGTVQGSKGGPAAAGTICFQSKWWAREAKNDFPRECLRDCVGSANARILMHSKVLFVRFPAPRRKAAAGLDDVPGTVALAVSAPVPEEAKDGVQHGHHDESDQMYAGWIYTGSANLSESAWGSIVVDAKTKTPKHINCRNWESGVVIPVPVSDHVRKELSKGSRTLHDMSLQEVFGEVIPVPIQEPAEKYVDDHGDDFDGTGKRPWFFMG